MRLIAVSGACSRAGKTALAETLIRGLRRRVAAVKFTTTEDVFERCPRGTTCVVCDISVPYKIVREENVLLEKGTDTARLASAGASRVIWAIARQSAATEAWAAVREMVRGEETVVMEGSTVVSLSQPDVLFFVAHPFLSPARWKETSAGLIRAAHACIVNRPVSELRDPDPKVLEEFARWGTPARIADVARPLEEWASDLVPLVAPGRVEVAP